MKKLFFSFWIITLIWSCKAQSTDELIAQNNNLDSNKVLLPETMHPSIDKIVAKILSRYHYSGVKFDDSLSSMVFDDFLKTLDYNRLYFLNSDITSFEKYRFNIDEMVIKGDVSAPFSIFNIYKQRINERIKYILELINKGEFDFTREEYYEPDRSSSTWSRSITETEGLLQKKIKNEFLNLKLTNKEDDEIKEVLSSRYKRFQKAILQYKSEEVFQLFMNSFAAVYDPHSNYFSPRASERFDMDMKLSFEGIGARLVSKNDYTTIFEIIPGGPAAKSGLLKRDDRIVSVGQGKDQDMIDVIGWRLDDVVQLIKGKKGTVVRLAVLNAGDTPGMPPDTITLVRDKVKLEEQRSKHKIITLKQNDTHYKFGVITVPKFYVNYDEKRQGIPDYISTANDVKKIIQTLKNENVDGIILDLRNNGGGVLQEAIELTGLFIKKGPVVQVRSSGGAIDLGDDPDPAIEYDGPLAVLVNKFSASASEIFAGAIQDYGRGLIIGESTYGKGTVQHLIDLNKFVPASISKLGQLKITVAKYYRITGSSTQNLGVIPDVEFPTAFPSKEYGESSQPTALKWDQIRSTQFNKFGDFKNIIPQLIEQHKLRAKSDPEWNNMVEDINTILSNRAKKKYSLNIETRKKEREEARKKRENQDSDFLKHSNLEISKNYEVEIEGSKIEDPALSETGYILSDFISIIIQNGIKLGQVK